MKIKVDEQCNVIEVTITNNWEKALREASNTIAKTLKNVFCEGMTTQRNRVWHKTTEQSEPPKLVLAITEGDGAVICGPNHKDWEGTVKEIGIVTWTYVEDLLPTRFEAIIETNKDELKRLKGGKQ